MISEGLRHGSVAITEYRGLAVRAGDFGRDPILQEQTRMNGYYYMSCKLFNARKKLQVHSIHWTRIGERQLSCSFYVIKKLGDCAEPQRCPVHITVLRESSHP